MTAFTHYWDRKTCELQESGEFGYDMDHIAGNQFKRRKVEPGDSVYVVNVRQGRLRLIGRIRVNEITDMQEAKRRIKAPYAASEHCFGKPDNRGSQVFGRYVPAEVVRHLTFINAKGKAVIPKFADEASGLLDSQTLRGVRQLTSDSAEKLESLL